MAEPTETQIPIVPEADDDLYNDDSDYGSISDGSATTSLSSSILNYQYENGRRYQSARQGETVLPNDDRELERQDLHHHICTLTQSGALYRAPLKQGIESILDLGTGTGNWAIDMADLFPEAVVTGTDLSPVQPGWVPPNCRFEIDDFELPWNFSQPFNYIHMRAIEGSVKDFGTLFKQAHDNLTPGGWFEICDDTVGAYSDDDSIDRATSMNRWIELLIEASHKFGKHFNVCKDYKQWMIDAGFKNVREEIYKIPFSPWAKDPKLKELGRYQQANMLEALEAYSLALMTRFLGWTVPDVQLLLAGVRKDLLDRKLHIYSKMYVVYGQRE
ncbi:S-adenosyl-L-methionine-dependent methyltransferase [Aspergillus pseudoustus]|uniref:S-adenosyl-L-methionine-dependent methyltransferase n=1 Tax=Aspergillus pseudoustus TaxID=1810923 RepID=A0ABR4J1U6_9EURO